ncbi:MAG: MFS transporter [Treponema sp.]|jgi:DHA1 family multidrug resistance protein-like MFS transporter|nr:MFS transporter [Treponema sp.]
MKLWKSNYSAILIAETMAIAGFALSMPVIPLFLVEDIGIDDPRTLKIWVGAIQSCSALALAFFAPIWGRLADVYSRRMMLLRAMFGGAVVVSLMVFVRNPLQLLILRTIQGCFTGTIAAATVLTVGIVPASRIALALGLLQTGVAIGNSLGPLMGGLISDFLGHRAAFLGTGLVLGGAGLIVLKWVEDEPSRHHLRPKGDRIRFFPELKPILESPTLITLMLSTFIIQAANTTAAPMLPLFLREIAEDSRYIGSATGIVLGVGAASTAVASIVAGRYSAHFGYWRTLFFCLAAGAILTVPQAFVTNMVQLTLFRALSSFCLGGATPVLNAILAVSTDKDHQGSVYGFNSSVSSAGGALGPMIGSAVAMINYRMVFLATAAILGFSAWETRRGEKRAGERRRGSAP